VTATQYQRLRKPSERVGTLAHAALPPPAISASDEEQHLLRALRERDEAAFGSLLDRFYSPMLRLAESFVRSREEAEEVVQDTWLAVLNGLDRFEGRSSLKTWIFRVLVNRARTRARREARTLPFSALQRAVPAESGRDLEPVQLPPGTESLDWYGAAWQPPTPEDEFLAAELHAHIEDAVRALPPRQREVITLRDIEGWTADEVCDLLEISDGNQRVLLHRARLKVRDALTEYVAMAGAGQVPAAVNTGTS
jgi:RNA polymerase sigma-70 factor, ECF subfamily